MARLTLFCIVVLAVVALSSAQLSGQSMGPLAAGGQTGGMGMGFGNPWQAIMWSRFLDMNPFYAMMLGGMGNGFLLPMLFARNW